MHPRHKCAGGAEVGKLGMDARVWSTLGGVLIFGVLETLFNQLGVNPYLKTVFQGAIIVLAVASYTIRSKKEAA